MIQQVEWVLVKNQGIAVADQSGFERKTFGEHGIIFEEGDDGDAAYLITKGRVEIRKGTRTGSPVSLAILSRGDIFGELALFDDRPRMAQALAVSDVEVVTIARDEFLGRIHDMDPVIKNMILYMIQRMRSMADEFMTKKTEAGWSNWKKIS